jgi:hypothetical protein
VWVQGRRTAGFEEEDSRQMLQRGGVGGLVCGDVVLILFEASKIC